MPDLRYKGFLRAVDCGQFVYDMRGEKHYEEFYVRMMYPIPARQSRTVGIKVGVDFEQHCFATLYVFYRTDPGEVDARSELEAALANAMEPDRLAIGV